MKKTKIWSIAIMSFLLIHNCYSQKRDYIATDSSLTFGIRLIEGKAVDNAQFVRVKREDSEIKYSPEQLIEYGFKNGTVYKSKNISISGQNKKVFLERLEHGNISLYYYTEKGIKTYFLERDSTLFMEISKDNFQKRISEITSDLEWKSDQVKLVNYNGKSLSKLISLYNNGYNKPLPFPRFGIISGYSRTSLKVPSAMFNEKLNGIYFTPSSSVSFGVFADLPIEMSDFSFNVGVDFSKSGFSVNSRNPQADVDVVVNITSLNMPVLLRYTIPTLVWRPFINAGSIYSYHLNNESKIYESSIDQNVITIHEVLQESLISKSMLGYSFGLGLQRNLNYRKIASAELRHNQLYGSKNTLNKRMLEILINFSF